jgi:succinate dehydrogenase flavin-adding protein (antitoxin of CptAB toxin-antitoxin module)
MIVIKSFRRISPNCSFGFHPFNGRFGNYSHFDQNFLKIFEKNNFTKNNLYFGFHQQHSFSSMVELSALEEKLRQKIVIPKDVNVLKKKIKYLSNERGMLENDLLLGSFTKLYLDKLSEPKLKNYLVFLTENDRDILNWIMNDQPIPQDLDGELIEMIKKHAKSNPLETLKKEDEKIIRQL